MSDTLRASLLGLNRARLITAAVVPAVGGILRQAGAFPYPFGPFGLAVLAAVAAYAILPLAQALIRDARAFARLQLALDVALVSAIVASSGGARSIFVPLYVLTVLAASFVLSRADAFAISGLSSVFYVAVAMGLDALASLGGVAGNGMTTDAESLPARVDPQRMREAIWNLCLNAVQAMPDGAEMRVGGQAVGEPEREQIQIWIADSGHGIADVDLPHIFEPFYSTKAGGIGLALVYRVLRDHGGLIEARSRPGDGTTFTLTLPAAREPQNAVLSSP